MKSQKADNTSNLCVIGGGAAGLMAAIFAAKGGLCVTVFEKNKSSKQLDSERYFDNCYLGKKLLITGKGRCNLTNDCTLEEFLANVTKNPKFMFSAFGFMPPQKVMEFFEDAGVPLKVERGRRVFPVSDRASDILYALKRRARECNVKFLNSEVTDLKISQDCVAITADKKEYTFSCAVLATGGKSYPITGSDGTGYELAKSSGHTITEIIPSLVPLETSSNLFHDISGLSLKNVKLCLYEKGKKKPLYEELGEMLFTHFGVSGPLVLSASAYMRKGNISDCYTMNVDLKPGLETQKLDSRILSDFAQFQNKNLENSLVKLLPQSLIKPLLTVAGLDCEQKVNSITREQRETLVKTIKALPVDICAKRPIDEAIVTSGGVKVSEINPSTMESKLCQRLYFAGEIIDVDAFTGGYNLQIAFCTGALAGKSCAEKYK